MLASSKSLLEIGAFQGSLDGLSYVSNAKFEFMFTLLDILEDMTAW